MSRPWGYLVLVIVLCGLPAAGRPQVRFTLGNTISLPNTIARFEMVPRLDFVNKEIVVSYRPLESDYDPIHLIPADAGGWRTWICRNVPWGLADAECTAPAAPAACCTGVGQGTCDETFQDNCFDFVYGYQVQCPADAGKGIGNGMIDLLANRICRTVAAGGIMPGANTCLREN